MTKKIKKTDDASYMIRKPASEMTEIIIEGTVNGNFI